MTDGNRKRVIGAQGYAAILLMLGAAAMMFKGLKLPALSGFLPVTILACLILLGTVLLISDIKSGLGNQVRPVFVENPIRVLGSFAAILLYTLAVNSIGFYTATVVMVPTVAWLFGYRNKIGVVTGTVIFVGSVFLIFNILMQRNFPQEFFLR